MTAWFSHRFVCVAVAFGALLVTSFVFHALLPPSIPQGVAGKLEFFAKHKDDFDTLFLGTSHFYYAVSPEIFDGATRAGGLPTRSFNFGIDGMHPPENFYVLEQILKARPQNLKWVFIELGEIETKSHVDVLGTQRLLYWHDWPRTLLTLKKTLNPRDGLKWYDNVSRIWSARRVLALHLGLFGKRFTNVGQAADWLPASEDDKEARSKLELGPAQDGYRLAGSAMPADRAARFQHTLALELSQARPRPIDRYTESAYREAATRIRELRAIPIFVVTPVIFQSSLHFRNSPPPGAVLSFNDAKKYPSFYDPAVRIDDGHLTRAGSEEFTRLLAQEFIRTSVPHPKP